MVVAMAGELLKEMGRLGEWQFLLCYCFFWSCHLVKLEKPVAAAAVAVLGYSYW